MSSCARLLAALALICSSAALASTEPADLPAMSAAGFLLAALAVGLMPLTTEDDQ